MSAQRTGRLYPQGNIPGTHLCFRSSLRRLQAASLMIALVEAETCMRDTTGDKWLFIIDCADSWRP